MVATISPLSIAGLVIGMLCHTTGGPVVGSMAQAFQHETSELPQLVSSIPAPARAAVRDFAQSSPIAAPIVRYEEPPVSIDTLVPAAIDHSKMAASFSDIVVAHARTVADSSVTNQAEYLVELINLARQDAGEAPVSLDPLLVTIARAHSEDMCARNYFDHYAPAPGPTTPMDRYVAALSSRPDYAMVGENIYYRSATDNPDSYASEAHDAFMHSPGHRANILTAQYTKVGVGIYVNPATGEYWVTEMFLRDSL